MHAAVAVEPPTDVLEFIKRLAEDRLAGVLSLPSAALRGHETHVPPAALADSCLQYPKTGVVQSMSDWLVEWRANWDVWPT